MKSSEIVGMIVQSTAGRDRKRVFLVLDACEREGRAEVTVADGTLRSMSAPKRKNLRHVRVIGRISDMEASVLTHPDDALLREIIAHYDPALQNHMEENNA